MLTEWTRGLGGPDVAAARGAGRKGHVAKASSGLPWHKGRGWMVGFPPGVLRGIDSPLATPVEPGAQRRRCLNVVDQEGAQRVRTMLQHNESTPARFRSELTRVPAPDRDAWLDLVFDLGALPDDGADLPRGCVPYIPCPVDALLRAIDAAAVQASDVFVDVGSGAGRTAALVHLLTGAQIIGLEIQAALVQRSRALMTQLSITGFTPLHGDATLLARDLRGASVFFLYCPFGGERLTLLLDALEDLARVKDLRLCCVDIPLPPRPWLSMDAPSLGDLAVYRTSHLGTAREYIVDHAAIWAKP